MAFLGNFKGFKDTAGNISLIKSGVSGGGGCLGPLLLFLLIWYCVKSPSFDTEMPIEISKENLKKIFHQKIFVNIYGENRLLSVMHFDYDQKKCVSKFYFLKKWEEKKPGKESMIRVSKKRWEKINQRESNLNLKVIKFLDIDEKYIKIDCPAVKYPNINYGFIDDQKGRYDYRYFDYINFLIMKKTNEIELFARTEKTWRSWNFKMPQFDSLSKEEYFRFKGGKRGDGRYGKYQVYKDKELLKKTAFKDDPKLFDDIMSLNKN